MTDTILSEPRDRPEAEIEITPAMVEAGVKVLLDSGAVENPVRGADEILVKNIFLAVYREHINTSYKK